MSSTSCRIRPVAQNGKPSKLFDEVYNHTMSREEAMKVWAFSQTQLFRDGFTDIEKDENGEPTYEAMNRLMHIEEGVKDSVKDMSRAKDMGLITPSGMPVPFEKGNAALSMAKNFNEKAKTKIAVVEKTTDDKYTVDIKENTPLAIAAADRNESRRKLNMALIKLVQDLGFNVEFVDDPSYNGVFDPLLAENNAKNLKTIIRLAKGEAGLNALPEEVSHLIIAMLKDHTLKARLDAVMTDDLVKTILGDQYDAYKRQYENSRMPVADRLREEAEGKLLADMLAGRRTIVQDSHPAMTLLRRLWNWAKQLFARTDTRTVDAAIADAMSILRPLQDNIQNDNPHYRLRAS